MTRRLMKLVLRIISSGWLLILAWAMVSYLLTLLATQDLICVALAGVSLVIGAITLSAAFLLTWGRLRLGGQIN